jgi:SAM-dependent methyltransferase
VNVRRNKFLERIDPAVHRGLEIGAQDRPTITRAQGDIRYVDYASTEELRRLHANSPTINLQTLVDVDYIWGERSLQETIGTGEQFDYIIASHVIEHVPDLVTWLNELAAVLKPGGVLSLIVPDKRLTFDRLRRTTDVSEVIQAWFDRRRKPSLQQIFDHYARHAQVDTQKVWSQTIDDASLGRVHDDALCLNICREAHASGRYVDVHCWVFTPRSFFEILRTLIQLDLFAFRVTRFHAPVPGELDFFVTLERMPDGLPPEERRQQQLASLPEAPESLHDVAAKAQEQQQPSAGAAPVPEASEREPRRRDILREKAEQLLQDLQQKASLNGLWHTLRHERHALLGKVVQRLQNRLRRDPPPRPPDS